MPHIDVRPAQPEDREAVLAFSTNTFEWGDYIGDVWEEWLTGSDGLLLIATVDDRPVGMAHLEMLTPIDAWLEGLRVDPQFRRQGIAKVLNENLLLEAMRRGATYARLAIEANNTRSLQITEQNHWRRIGAFTPFSAPAPQTAPRMLPVSERPRIATPADLDMIIDFLNASNIFPIVGGLYHVRWKARPFTAELLEEKIAAQQVYILHRWERMDGIAVAEPQQKRLSVGYIDGTAIEAVSLLVYDLQRRVVEMGLDGALVFAPDMVLIRDALTGIGYDWEDMILYTYERGLT